MVNSKSHPKGLYVLFATEMWERFSYYGNRALLVLFLVQALAWTKTEASTLYGNYTSLVFMTPLIGGYIADRYWGNVRSIIVGGALMAIGQFLMFFAASNLSNMELATPLLYGALTCLAVGNGFFKPNISNMVGQLYVDGDQRKDSAYTIFYMGINAGSFLASVICGWVGNTGNPEDFKWGFLLAGIGMIIGLIFFMFTSRKYVVGPDGQPIGIEPAMKKNENLAKENNTSSTEALTKIEIQRIIVILVLAFFVIFFWATFEQHGASLNFFATEQMDRNFMGIEIPAASFQALNPLVIILFAPIFASMWSTLGSKGLEPSSPLKMALGLFLLAAGYGVIAVGVTGLTPGVKVSMFWLVGMYVLHTFGEICLSPIGLSLVNKLAPAKFASIMMSIWFLANAAANKMAGVFSTFYPEIDAATGEITKAVTVLGFQIDSLTSFFIMLMSVSLISAVVLFVVYRPLLKMMHGVK